MIKQHKTRLFSVIAILILLLNTINPMVVSASEMTEDFTVDENGIITQYNGSGGDVEIPSQIKGITIKAIGEKAFKQKQITSVQLPKGLKKISFESFADNDLTELNLPESLTEIGASSFKNNQLKKVTLPDKLQTILPSSFENNELEQIDLPDTLKVVDQNVFKNNKLKEIKIPDSVIEIRNSAFENNNIKTVALPDSLKRITRKAFEKNEIIELELPNSLTELGAFAFKDNNISNLTLPNRLEIIPTQVFQNNELTSIAIPSSVKTIANFSFRYNNFTEETVEIDNFSDKVKYYEESFTNKDDETIKPIFLRNYPYFEFDKDTGTLIKYHQEKQDVSDGNYKYSDIVIPSEIDNTPVEIIGESAFEYGLLSGVTIPNTVTKIEARAFQSNKIEKIQIPESVKSIGDYSFYGNNAQLLELSDNLEEIGKGAFSINEIKDLKLPKSIKKIDEHAFNTNKLKSLTIPEGITELSYGVFNGNLLEEVLLPSTLNKIGKFAFYGNRLSEITIPHKVKHIDNSAFRANSLMEIHLPESVIEISDYAFFENQILQGKATIDNKAENVKVSEKAFQKNGEDGETTITPVYLKDNEYDNELIEEAGLVDLQFSSGVGNVEISDSPRQDLLLAYEANEDTVTITPTAIAGDLTRIEVSGSGVEKGLLKSGESFEVNLKHGTNLVVIDTIAADEKTKKKYNLYLQRKHTYSPARVAEYLPAPGQFTNGERYGRSPERILYGPWEYFLPGGYGVSLGSFGGYIILEFDESIENNEDHPYGIDFIIHGNSFTGWGEPGAVQVLSEDDNEWYDIAGSEHYEDTTIHDYEITYSKQGNSNQVKWTDNQGESGILAQISSNYPKPEIYNTSNLIVPEDNITFSGVKLDDNLTFSNAPAFGYVDVHPNGSAPYNIATNPYANVAQKGTPIDLDWAVDQEGQPVRINSVKQIKVYTSISAAAGVFGEISTEVMGAARVSPIENTDETNDLDEIKLITDQEEMNIELKPNQYIYDIDIDDDTFTVAANGDVENLFINNERLALNTPSKKVSLHGDEMRTIRVIVQSGAAEPKIYYLNLTKGKEEGEAVDKSSLIDVIGEAKGKDENDYTESSYLQLLTALTEAELVNENEAATQEEVDNAVQSLQDALAQLEEKHQPVDKSALKAMIDEAELLDTTGKTDSSIQALEAAITSAKAIVEDDDASEEQVKSAISSLEEAIANLEDMPVPEVDRSSLIRLIEEAEALDFEGMTEESVANLRAALGQAKVVVANAEATEEEVDQAVKGLEAAIEALEETDEELPPQVDKSELKAMIEVAEEIDTAGKTDSSIQVLEAAITSAKAIVEDDDASEEQVESVIALLEEAIANLEDIPAPEVDKAALIELIDEVEVLDLEGKTEKSIANLLVSLGHAKVVVANKDATQTDVDEAKQTLQQAVDQLEDKPEASAVDKSALNKALTRAKAIDQSKLTDESAEQLQQAIAAAENVLASDEATQADIDNAISQLEAVLAKLKEKDIPVPKPEEKPKEKPSKPETPEVPEERPIEDDEILEGITEHPNDENHDAGDEHQDLSNQTIESVSKELPSTATTIFNVLTVGLIILLMGILISVIRRKRQKC